MNDDILGLSDRMALVVGGGYGIGRATAILLAKAGAHVAVADADADRAEAVSAEIRALGRRSLATCADVRDPDDCERVVDEAFAFSEGTLEIVTNIVGVASTGTLLDLDDATWDNAISLNLRHHLLVARAAARRMIAARLAGRIAMLSSVDAYYGAANHGAYGAAKAGVVSLTKTMAQEWGPFGIRVNAVAPDGILTPRLRDRMLPLNDALNRNRPFARFGEPEEVAGALLYLVSDLASYVTGHTLIVDGGMMGVPAGRAGSPQPPTTPAGGR